MTQAATRDPADVAGFFASEGLPEPPVPAPFRGALRQWDEWVFATTEPEHSPWNVEAYVEEALADPSPRLLIAHAGYGINSAAIHYFLVQGGLALFLQVPWGGAYTEDEDAVAVLRARFDQVRLLVERAPAALGAGERLFVTDTVGERLWARVSPASASAGIAWRASEDSFAAALASVSR